GTAEPPGADRGCDRNAGRRFLQPRRIQPIIPARSNNTQATDQDGRCLRRYRRRWIVERTIGWLGNFRRLTVRYDRLLATYGGFFHLACALLVLRRVLKWLLVLFCSGEGRRAMGSPSRGWGGW